MYVGHRMVSTTSATAQNDDLALLLGHRTGQQSEHQQSIHQLERRRIHLANWPNSLSTCLSLLKMKKRLTIPATEWRTKWQLERQPNGRNQVEEAKWM